MGYKVFAQIGLVVVSLVLIFIYIEPTFTKIGLLQDDVFEYQDAVTKAEELNNQLASLVRQERSYSVQDREALETFLPDQVDTAQVMRDLEALFVDYEVAVESVTSADQEDSEQGEFYLEDQDLEEVPDSKVLQHQDFSVSIVDSYENVKKFLALIESNAYPLEVVKMSLGYKSQEEDQEEQGLLVEDEEELFTCSLTLRVQSLSAPITPVE